MQLDTNSAVLISPRSSSENLLANPWSDPAIPHVANQMFSAYQQNVKIAVFSPGSDSFCIPLPGP